MDMLYFPPNTIRNNSHNLPKPFLLGQLFRGDILKICGSDSTSIKSGCTFRCIISEVHALTHLVLTRQNTVFTFQQFLDNWRIISISRKKHKRMIPIHVEQNFFEISTSKSHFRYRMGSSCKCFNFFSGRYCRISSHKGDCSTRSGIYLTDFENTS